MWFEKESFKQMNLHPLLPYVKNYNEMKTVFGNEVSKAVAKEGILFSEFENNIHRQNKLLFVAGFGRNTLDDLEKKLSQMTKEKGEKISIKSRKELKKVSGMTHPGTNMEGEEKEEKFW